ncbi:hypothetical protein [Streptomyces laurentii]|uniref:hypothetical protein n=1 Tax=Streptomyces laurentii TaxID=39478 RepID=UPI0036896E7E
MRQEWEPEDLIEVWTLLEEDQERLRNKSGANRLGVRAVAEVLRGPYGRFELDLNSHLDLAAAASVPGPRNAQGEPVTTPA